MDPTQLIMQGLEAGFIIPEGEGYAWNPSSSISPSLGFEDVALLQGKNRCKSRLEPNLRSEFVRGMYLDIPLIASNMSTVVNVEMCRVLGKAGALGVMHRAWSNDRDYIAVVEDLAEGTWSARKGWSEEVKPCEIVAASVGVGVGQVVLAEMLYKAGAHIIVIDVAHGYSDAVKETAAAVKKRCPFVKLIVGNTINLNALYEFDGVADALKIGIGQGCFAAGTRILLSNGFYKNIEEVSVGDCVINKDGLSVLVKKSFCTGTKKVIKVRNSLSPNETLVTPDHRYWVGDLSSTSKGTISSRGYRKLLDVKSKTSPKKSKYKWMSVQDIERGCFLLPRKINFELASAFKVELKKRVGGNWRTGSIYAVDAVLEPSYDLGYVFGTFLGDGYARSYFDKKRRSHKGSVGWFYGKGEGHIARKTSDALYKVLGRRPEIVEAEKTLDVYLYYKPLADFLYNFGKRTEKHLPEELLVDHVEYLEGLWDGLVDSDGHYGSDGRVSLGNTSLKVIELFNVLTYLVKGHFPVCYDNEPTAGGLLNCNIDNCNPSWVSCTLKNSSVRFTRDYYVCKWLGREDLGVELPVYDLEVDCETHSFIADNAIVHNSACETKNTAGCTEKQFSAVLKFKEEAKRLGMPIISDGGVREPADMVKAIAAGASSVMVGSLFAATDESAAPWVDGKRLYAGMASEWTQKRWRGGLKPGTCAEGKVIHLEPAGPVASLVERYTGALRSGITYAGATDIKSFQDNVEFITV